MACTHLSVIILVSILRSSECFCGDTNPALKDARPESECDNPSSGNATEVGRGAWRLSVYATGITDYPDVGRLLGCFKYGPSNEFPTDIKFDVVPLTNRRCLNLCTLKGYKYSGVLPNGNLCGCTNIQPPPSSSQRLLRCEKRTCSGDATEMCGDIDRVKVYRTRLADMTNLGEVKYMGCYEDRNDIRMVEDFRVPTEGSISGELCAEVCRNKGFAFSSLDAGKECFCGHSYPPPFLRRSDSKCDRSYSETSNKTCGVSTRISVYETGLPNNQARVGRVYVGCFEYGEADGNPFKGSTQMLKNNSPDVCHKLCLRKGFVYFGLTKANICSCGDEDVTTGRLQSETQCSKECSGDANKKCGGETVFSVYRTGLEESSSEPLGCFLSDEPSLNEYTAIVLDSNTPQRCLKVCRQMGFFFTGTENGNICRCGNAGPESAAERDDAKCDSLCAGSPMEVCGGINHIKLYSTSSILPEPCPVSDSTRNGKPICKVETMLDENFDILNTSRWKYSVRMPGDPDYEFVTYTKSPSVVFVRDGKLHIKPMPWLDNYTRAGEETLVGCTGKPSSEECTRTANSFNILPPVLSAQITTADSLSFRFGRLDIRAKLPSGDWIVPQIWLTPKESAYGARFASGQIRIACVRGNKNLQCDRKEMGSRTLQSGMLFGPSNNTVLLLGRNESVEEWSKNFHNYSLVWTKESLSFFVDGKLLSQWPQRSSDALVDVRNLPQNVRNIWQGGSRLAPFDKEFYLTLGVSVGGLRDFPDSCSSNGSRKPWSNASPSRAMLDFWKKRDEWKGTWSGDGTALQIDHIKLAAL